MLIPVEKINEAKDLYGEKAIQEIIQHFGLEGSYNQKDKSCSCPWHIDKTPSFIWNSKNNCFHCFSCSRNYGIIDLYLEQGNSYLQSIKKLFDNVGIEYKEERDIKLDYKNYVFPKHVKNDRTSVESYMSLRKISKKTLDYADVQSDIHKNIVFHFYDENDMLKTVKYRLGRKYTREDKEQRLPKCWHQKDADNTPILFNMNRVIPTEPLVITEGEIDCLSVIESGYKNVVSIPKGCSDKTWIEYNWDWLEQFDKIIIWFDSDSAGVKARDEVCHRLGTWRTYYVDMKEETDDEIPLKDINELLYFKGKDIILEYINKPLEIPIDKVKDLSKAEEFDIENAEGLYTGIKDLDDRIYKIVFGTVNIITGKSGEGKSVFVNQLAICQALQQGYDVFVFSGELPAPLLRNWVETNMIGRDFVQVKNNYIRVLDGSAKKAMNNWYSGRVIVYDDDYDTTAKSLLNKMEEMARKRGTKVFVIDNLMMVDLECSEEARLQTEKSFIKDLILFAKKFNVLVFLVAHPRKIGNEVRVSKEDIAGSGNIVNLAHMVFSVHRYTDKEKQGETNLKNEYIKGKEPKEHDTVIEVLKNRITGALPTVDLYYDYPTSRFYRTPKELWFRYGWDKRDISTIPDYDPNEHKIIKAEEVSPI